MQKFDAEAQKYYAIAAKNLMHNAGCGIRKLVEEVIAVNNLTKNIVVFAGKGNNAGDAFCLINLLRKKEYTIKLFMTSAPSTLSPTAKYFFDKICTHTHNIEIITLKTGKDIHLHKDSLNGFPIIIDALLGTGFNGKVTGVFKETINFINSLNKTTISIDIPSGLNATTGCPEPIAVTAHYTPTMAFPKIGMFLENGPNYCGTINVVDIGFPSELTQKATGPFELITDTMIAPLFPRRNRISHKGDYGHVLIIAGSRGMSGAAYMASCAALRSGAGMVTLAIPESLTQSLSAKVTEQMILPLPETDSGSISTNAINLLTKNSTRFDAILLGPGISTHPNTTEFVQRFVSVCKKPLIVDADGLNALSENISILKKRKAPILLTPHIGEFSRLTKRSKKDILKETHAFARSFSAENNTLLLLKGYNSIVTEGKNIFINPTGNPGMATAGMGDVLSGIIVSLMGQRLTALKAAQAATYIHGLAGDIVSKKIGENGLIASDVISNIPLAIKKLQAF